ncbi:acid-sensing ion channel 3-like isoform X2 [Scylla paramamosain]|uniref:acid-sensing ion channel 3-like isoform X2 n=1 Tax=Scylla paramamosain TaxID=85552 RepID=UPI003083E7AB
MRVSYDDANLTALPGVTICPSDKFDFHNLLRLWRKAGRRDKMPKDVDLKLLGVSNLTLEEVWRQGGFHLHRLVAQVAVHDPLRLASEAIEDGMPCPQKITKTRRKLGCHRLVSVTLQHVQLLDRTSRPCRQKANYSSKVCRLTCLHAHVLRRHGCRLPYMLGEGRACRTEEEVRRVSGAIYHLHDYGRFNYTAACDCPPACSLSIYRANTDTTWNTQRNSVVKVFMEGTQSERVEESYAYPVPALVSHIGGFMGLLLGASILSFLQLLEIPLLKAYALAVWALQECGRMLGRMGVRRQAWTSVGSGSLHQATRKEQTD